MIERLLALADSNEAIILGTHFWTIIAVVNEVRYGVIIRRKEKQGNKYFYSIIPNYEGCIPRGKKLKIHFE